MDASLRRKLSTLFNQVGRRIAQCRDRSYSQSGGCELREYAPAGFSFICEAQPLTFIIIWGGFSQINNCSLQMLF